MLKCNYIKHGLCYENYLIDVLNASMFFGQKKPFLEKYRKPTSEAHGECDALSSTYSIDFKLVVDENVMKARTRNRPSVDYSQLSKGLIFTKTNSINIHTPQDILLEDILHLKPNDIQNETFQNNSIRSILKNLKKPKNLLLYLPYEFKDDKVNIIPFFSQILTAIFAELMRYREQEQGAYETYICLHANSYFMIFQWKQNSFVFVDEIPELCCSSYMDYKTLALY